MKMFPITRISIATITFIFATVLFSCQKNISSSTQSVTADQAATYSEESAVSASSFDDAEDIATTAADEEANASQYGINGREFHPLFTELRAAIGDCATITISPNDSTYPKSITIDFGDSCVGLDGKLRAGKITVNISAPFRKPGSVVSTSFSNYFVNHIHIEGTKTFTNLSDTTTHTIKWKVEVTGGKVTFPSGRGYSFESVKTKTQVAGMDTRICRDDVYEIEGRSQTTFNNGITVILDTETALVKKVVCPWISDGKLTIKINDRILYLDYGFPAGGQCDNKALLTWNDGNSQRIINL